MADYKKLIDAETWAFIERTNAFYPPDAVDQTIEDHRRVYDAMCEGFRTPYPESVTAETTAIETPTHRIPIRIYRTIAPEAAAMVLYFHGGGFVLGGLESHDSICADIAHRTGYEVVSVDYRLAPEHLHPAAFDDAMSAFEWAATAYTRAIVLVGDSAGANLAAAVSHATRGHQRKPAGQVLIYPGLGGDMTKGSYVNQSRAPGLSTADVQYYRDIYKGGGSKYAEPLREMDLFGLPPAFLVAAGLDPLHDDCLDYLAKLQAAGVPAVVRDEPLLVHAFIRARNMSVPARASFDAIIEAAASLAHSGQLPSRTT